MEIVCYTILFATCSNSTLERYVVVDIAGNFDFGVEDEIEIDVPKLDTDVEVSIQALPTVKAAEIDTVLSFWEFYPILRTFYYQDF